MSDEIFELEQQIGQMIKRLGQLRAKSRGSEVGNYMFQTLQGKISLLELFADKEQLLLIHNMGQACRYCTLWADGLNGFVPHFESVISVALVSKDAPELQRRFANSRGWRFNLASHGGGDYIREQSVMPGADNMPGAVMYQRRDDKIFRRNACVFGPGDVYSPIWPMLGMAGMDETSWTPQFSYWMRPRQMEDGGENLPD